MRAKCGLSHRARSGGVFEVPRRSTLALGTMLAVLVVPLVVAPARARSSAKSEHDRVVAYWPPARMAAAQPRDFVRAGDKFVPRARPGGGGNLVTGKSFA